MNTSTSKMLAAGCALWLALGQASFEAWAQDHNPRQVKRHPGRPIEQLVKQGEPSLVVLDSEDPPLVMWPEPATSMVDWLSKFFNAILVVQITERHSDFVPSGTWVRSEVIGRIVSVVRGPQEAQPGGQIRFEQSGGTVQVAETTVSAVVPHVREMLPGERYLMFVNLAGPDKEILVWPHNTYEVTSGTRLRRLTGIPPLVRDEIEGARLRDVVSRIRRSSHP